MNKGVFVTGTGTDCGKTYIACKIAEALRNRGINVGVMKPVASGGRDDAKKLVKAADISEPIENVNPVFLKLPLAPYISAKIEGRKINLAAVSGALKYLGLKYSFLVVEGAGGIYVPVKKGYFMLDMIKEFGFPALVVAKPYLGTINHTLLTVKRLEENGVRVLGVILSGGRGKTLAERTNQKALKELTGLPVTVIRRGGRVDLGKNKWITG